MKENKEHFDGIKPFDVSAKYVEIYADSPGNTYASHIHEECEIYVNLTGDVSFIVEDNIYPVNHGDIIITRPYEYHHCVYHSHKIHKHFWILFSSDGNEPLFGAFFNRKPGEANRLSLSAEDTETLVSLCHKMTETELSQVKKYANFLSLISLLQSADIVKSNVSGYPQDTLFAINYINSHFAEKISVTEIARLANVSVNTLERHFLQTLNITPYGYLGKKRLANAAKLLSEGCSVTEASTESGFPDYSGFISLFKSTYGITPLKYKKSREA